MDYTLNTLVYTLANCDRSINEAVPPLLTPMLTSGIAMTKQT